MKKNISKLKVLVLSVLILLFFLRLSLPQYVKYLLFPLLFVTVILFFLELIQKQIVIFGKKIFKIELFSPLVVITLFYIGAYILTQDRQNMLTRDFVNVFSVFSVSFILWIFISNDGNLKNVIFHFRKFVLISSTAVAALGLVKLYFQLHGVEFYFLKPDGFGYPEGTSLAVDDNFFTLVSLFGFIFILPILFKRTRLSQRILYQLILVALFFNIFFSTSRRGIVIASTILVGTFFIWILSICFKHEKLRVFRINTYGFGLISFSIVSIIFYLLVYIAPIERNQWLSYSSYNQNEVHNYANALTLSINSIFKGEVGYQEINCKIWQSNFDSRYPYSGWASGNYTSVSILDGGKKGMLPPDAVGAKVDKTVGATFWRGNAYYFSKLFDGKIEHGKRYAASLYCYVSSDFNGDWVRINSSPPKGLTVAYYDMKNKGTWQKLQTSFYGDSINYTTYFYFCKEKSTTLDSLNGYVIFAYPEIKEIKFDPRLPITWAGAQFDEIILQAKSNASILPDSTISFKFNNRAINVKDSLIYAVSNIYTLCNDKELRNVITIYAYVSEDFNGDEVYLRASGRYRGLGINRYNLANKGKWERLYLSLSPENSNVDVNIGFKKIINGTKDSLKGYVLFAYPQKKIMQFDSKNPITWAERKYKEFKPNIGINAGIVPVNSIGYLVDKESDFVQSKSSRNYVTYTRIGKKNVLNEKRYISSVYCYVSKDFNGDKVKLGSWGKFFGSSSDYYDLNRKGEWQKLFLNNYGDSSYVEPFLYFEIPDNKIIEWLKGYVVFACPEFDILDYSPSNPSSYSKTTFKQEYPLVGESSGIIPQNVTGFRLDRTAIGMKWKNIYHSTTEFLNIPTFSGDSISASVYCYVSDDFDGNDVRLEIKGKIKGQTIARYDLKNKGKWVKLEIKTLSDGNERVSGILFFSQKDVSDFSTLKGHVTFAYPIIKVVKSKTTNVSQFNRVKKSNETKIFKSSFFPLLQIFSNAINSAPDSLNVEPQFHKEMIKDHFSGPRLDRWRYALYIYKHEYKWWQRIIGGGFGFTRKFANMFNEPEVKHDYDYPHNPFLGVLLYSGIIGLIAYIWFLFRAIYYYWLYKKEYWTLGLCFGVTFFFAFFSANTPFDPAIMGVLTILPYFIHYYHLKENLQTND